MLSAFFHFNINISMTISNQITQETGNLVISKDNDVITANNTVITNNISNQTDNWSKPFWRSVFSSSNGGGSTSRVSTFLIVFDVLLIADYIVFRNKAIPERLLDLGIFAALLICTIYAPAKVASIFDNYFGKK